MDLLNINHLDFYNKTPLMYACEICDEDLIKYLN